MPWKRNKNKMLLRECIISLGMAWGVTIIAFAWLIFLFSV